MVDEQDAERPHARLDEVAVLPRARFVEAELVAAEMRAASGEEAGPRPRGGRASRAEPMQLLQAAQPRRNRTASPPVRERHFADVDVAARVDGEPVRRDELTRL